MLTEYVTTHNVVQACVLTISLAAVTLLTGKKGQRWGHVVGLCSQPFWLYAAFSAGQWGMMVLSIVYTGMWIRGIRNNFGKKREEAV